MKHEEMIRELEEVARQLGVKLRYERGDFEGGYCILKTERVLLLNRRLLPARRAMILAVALHEIGLDDLFIKPVVREYIEDEVARAAQAPPEEAP